MTRVPGNILFVSQIVKVNHKLCFKVCLGRSTLNFETLFISNTSREHCH